MTISRIEAPGDTARPTDSLETSALLTIRVDSEPTGVLVFASLDSVTVRFPRRAPLPAGMTTLAPILIARTDSGRLRRDSPPPVGCAPGVSTYGAFLRDVLPLLPTNAAIGTWWTDSTVDLTCRGGISVTVSSTSRSQLLASGEDPHLPLHIVRQSNLRLAGLGIVRSQTATLDGSGTRTTVFVLDPALGSVALRDEQSRIDFTVGIGTRSQRFLQMTRQVLTPTSRPGKR
ncbi:MAG: hypothetical protein NVS4B3_03960 [Gemmatimonadaceae bacterium]